MTATSDGEGVVTETENPCSECGGEMTAEYGWLELPAGIYPAYEIFEHTALKEYKALEDDERAMYDLIISQGTIDMTEGGESKSELWDLFGAGSTTRANLIAMLSE
jgi:hypothetical protein